MPSGGASSGTLRGLEQGDILAALGVFKASGTLSPTEHHDLFTGGTSGATVASLSGHEGHDLLAGLGGLASSGHIAATERHDAFLSIQSGLYYNIYSNTGIDDPINYATPIATTSLTTWTSGTLAVPGTWMFAVRAFNQYGEEKNLDCEVTFTISAAGIDITNVPPAPNGLRGFAAANSSVTLVWTIGPYTTANAPVGFHCYYGTSGAPNYGTVRATVLATSAKANSFTTTIKGLASGTNYWFGVRSYNATGEEQNTNSVEVTPNSVGPTAVVDLTATLIV